MFSFLKINVLPGMPEVAFKTHESGQSSVTFQDFFLIFIFLGFILIFLCVWVSSCVCTICKPVPNDIQGDVTSPGTGIVGSCKLSCECREENPGPLQGQQV